MSYMVDVGKGKKMYFATFAEANGFANEVLQKTRIILGIFESKHKVTHEWKGENNGR